MSTGEDDVHTCPACGGSWKQVVRFRQDGHQWFVPADTGWCVNPACEINRDDERLAAYRALRRSSGWDASE